MSNRSVLAFQNLTISTDAGTEDIYCKAEHSLPEHDCSVPVRWWRSIRHGSIPVPTAPEIRSEPGSQPAKRRMLSGSLPPAFAILPIPSNCCAANSPPSWVQFSHGAKGGGERALRKCPHSLYGTGYEQFLELLIALPIRWVIC
jgi:hypothetical protein